MLSTESFTSSHLLDETYSTGPHLGFHLPPHTQRLLWASKTQDCRLTTDCCKSDRISRGHILISYHNTLTFPLDQVTASAYFPVVYTGTSCNHIVYTTGTSGCQGSICNNMSLLRNIYLSIYLYIHMCTRLCIYPTVPTRSERRHNVSFKQNKVSLY